MKRASLSSRNRFTNWMNAKLNCHEFELCASRRRTETKFIHKTINFKGNNNVVFGTPTNNSMQLDRAQLTMALLPTTKTWDLIESDRQRNAQEWKPQRNSPARELQLFHQHSNFTLDKLQLHHLFDGFRSICHVFVSWLVGTTHS